MTTDPARIPDCAEPPLGDLADDERRYTYPTDLDDPATPETHTTPGGTLDE